MPRPRRHLCLVCAQHPAGYFDRFGRFKAASDHPLCMRCYRSERDRQRARVLRPAWREDAGERRAA